MRDRHTEKSAKITDVHGDRTLAGIITRETVDEEGEVIIASGLDTGYDEKVGGVSVLWNHNYDVPIGKVRRLVPRDDGWYASIKIAETPKGDEALILAKEGILHFSIGFMRLEHGLPTEQEKAMYPGVEYVTRRSRIHELTLTPVPAHGDANLIAKSLKSLCDGGKIRHSTWAEFARPSVDWPARPGVEFPVRPSVKFG